MELFKSCFAVRTKRIPVGNLPENKPEQQGMMPKDLNIIGPDAMYNSVYPSKLPSAVKNSPTMGCAVQLPMTDDRQRALQPAHVVTVQDQEQITGMLPESKAAVKDCKPRNTEQPENLYASLKADKPQIMDKQITSQKQSPVGKNYISLLMDEVCRDKFESRYTLLNEIGRGGFSTVYRGERGSNKTAVAVKVSKLNVFSERKMKNQKLALEIMRECSSHVNITRLVESFLSKDGKQLKIVMELVEGFSLHDLCAKLISFQRFSIPLHNIACLNVQMVKGLCYLHSKGIVHCDIKSQNVMISGTGTVKICDLGMAVHIGRGDDVRTYRRGTPQFMSPEIAMDSDVYIYTPSCDIWSMGLMTLGISTFRYPFYEDNESTVPRKELYKRISKGIPSIQDASKLPPDLVDFIQSCTMHLAEERSSAEELFSHDWLQHASPASTLGQLVTKIENKIAKKKDLEKQMTLKMPRDV